MSFKKPISYKGRMYLVYNGFFGLFDWTVLVGYIKYNCFDSNLFRGGKYFQLDQIKFYIVVQMNYLDLQTWCLVLDVYDEFDELFEDFIFGLCKEDLLIVKITV